MMALYEQIKVLYDSQLYSSLRTLTSLVLTMCDHSPELLTIQQKFLVLVYQAEALYNVGEYLKAESVFRKAIHVRKMICKTKGKTAQSSDLPSDVEVRYQLHLCYCKLKQYADATSVLEAISSKQRTPKVNMALAQLYHHKRTGMDRSAVTCYKEVLRECPLALDAALGLLALGVKGSEVASLMMANVSSIEWLSSWIKANAAVASKEYQSAIVSFQLTETKNIFRDNVDILSSLGEAQFLNGDYTQALTTLQRVNTLDPFHLPKMDILAYLLMKDKQFRPLGNLSTQLMNVTDSAPEPWVALGYFAVSIDRSAKAEYFAKKALAIDSQNLEALLLRGTVLLKRKQVAEAIGLFRDAVQLAPYRFEAHQGLVDCFMANSTAREAIMVAGQAFRQLGASVRIYTLYASALAKEPVNLDKARSYLEKAMKLDPNYLEAVYAMADILQQQKQYDKGIELLRRVLRQRSTCRLHRLLGDFLAQMNEPQEALDQYNIALGMDPTDVKAREGVERVEKQGDVGVEGAYYVEVEEMSSENEGELDGSYGDGGWSDTDN